MTDIPATVRAVVVDDEPSSREAVLTMLADYPAIEVVGEASNGREAVCVVRATRPDLLFLDIQMPDQDGFGVLETLGEHVPRGVVFVTAHDEHAIRAFEVHALDYVLKPFGRPRFGAAVSRAVERLNALDALTLQRTLASMANDRLEPREPAGELAFADAGRLDLSRDDPQPESVLKHGPRRIGVRTGSKTVLIDVDAIDWVEALGDYARIHVATKVHLVTQRMHALERLLDARRFVRIHRSSIVNINRVQVLHREADGSGTVVLTNGIRLRVARGRWEVLQLALEMEEC
jgi:two-component system, LytTR family, response regulator